MKKISLLSKIIIINSLFFIFLVLSVIFKINSHLSIILIPILALLDIFLSIYCINKSSDNDDFIKIVNNFLK